MLLLPDMCPLRRAGDPQVIDPLDPPSPVRPQAPLPLSPFPIHPPLCAACAHHHETAGTKLSIESVKHYAVPG